MAAGLRVRMRLKIKDTSLPDPWVPDVSGRARRVCESALRPSPTALGWPDAHEGARRAAGALVDLCCRSGGQPMSSSRTPLVSFMKRATKGIDSRANAA
ncbi:hypothetical protein GCM10025734_66630 [Kitasatospora paranensis]